MIENQDLKQEVKRLKRDIQMYQNPNGADEIEELTKRYKEVEKTLEEQQHRNRQLDEKLKEERRLREQENLEMREAQLRAEEQERQVSSFINIR